MSTVKTINVQHPSSASANLVLDASGNVTVANNVTVTGGTVIPVGSASAPSIYPTGDSNTGIYSPGANRLGFTTDGTQRGEFDATGNFQFNSGYGSVATAYGCRAWVNFDGTSNSANLSGTYSQSGTTVTVTATAHGLVANATIYADITSGTGVDGTYTVVTVTDANTFTYTAGTSLTTSGNITLRRNTIRASGNVSSVADNAAGDYSVNFATAMPDTSYCILATTGNGDSTGGNYSIGIYGTGAAQAQNQAYLLTGSVRVLSQASNGTNADSDSVHVAIFR